MVSLGQLDAGKFPPLVNSSSTPPIQSSPSRVLDRLWSNILAEPAPSAPHIPISLLEISEEIIPFDKDFTDAAATEWSLCLVGYSIGKRPYYEALKETAHRIWKLKGTFQLIALIDGFFLFKFSLPEDYDMVCSKGVWFFHGKPFVFQKWTKNFHHTRENFTSVPIWVRVHNLPLVCWNSEGISKIASKIGIPIAVDALTAAKTRLTYARICIQVSTTSLFLNSVAVSIEGEVLNLQVQYEWKPTPCTSCAFLAHSSAPCPSTQKTEPKEQIQFRGRSSSQKPRAKSQMRPPTPHQTYAPVIKPVSTLSNQAGTSSVLSLAPSQVDSPPTAPPKAPTSDVIAVVNVVPPEPSTSQLKVDFPSIIPKPINTEFTEVFASTFTKISNLNSPSVEGLGETETLNIPSCNPPNIQTSSKYSSLQGSEDSALSGSENDSFSFSEPNMAIKEKKKTTPQPKSTRGKGSKKPPASSSKNK
ncbi:hypothetical protein KFK09_017700 [Dendrobium nobile]|uniref:DUF4283 domain-containing protein n=1 Tax=Dendrobium nobile TaxID=94219 RepID=A0A8T3AS85_DENNO|nr:hypothetical protein KFK09_017700 [Dendrobium nobile]